MSRRIRSIKPEIIEDEKTGPLSDTAFRLFTSMITIADDLGNVRADVRWLQAQIWWAHPSPPDVLPALIELTKCGLVHVYGVRGGTFAHLNGWTKHQRVDNAGKSRVPLPNDADALEVLYPDPISNESSPRVAASRREIPLDRMGEDGRGVSGKPDLAASFAEVAVTEINRRANSKFDPASKSTVRLSSALVKAKHTEAEAIEVIAFKARWLSEPDNAEYFRPSTLLALDNFEKYLDESRSKKAATIRIAAPDSDEPQLDHLLTFGAPA